MDYNYANGRILSTNSVTFLNTLPPVIITTISRDLQLELGSSWKGSMREEADSEAERDPFYMEYMQFICQ